MAISQRCVYGLKAALELALRYGQGPIKISEIACAQSVPARFLESILNQLRHARLVVSLRGARGGYLLASPPNALTVGAVIRAIEGEAALSPVVLDSAEARSPADEESVFSPLWTAAQRAMAEIFERTTFQDLVEEESRREKPYVPNFVI